MASAHVSTRSILSSFLPRLSAPTASSTFRHTTLYSRQLSHPLLPSISFAIPASVQLNVPGFIDGLWESILRAVPKKKTSYMKKRSRQMAGKGLQDVTSLNKCSVCGNIKRAHLLCPFCIWEVQNFFKGKLTKQYSAEEKKERNAFVEEGKDNPYHKVKYPTEDGAGKKAKKDKKDQKELEKDKDDDVKY